MRSLQVTVIFCFLLTVRLSAQSNYQPGLVVKNGDTLRGFIDHKEWTKNPRSFDFKKSVDDKSAVEFKPKQVSFVRVQDEEYSSYAGTITMDQNSIKIADAPVFATVDDTVFLKVVASGSLVTLLEFRDNIKTRFFLSTNGRKPVELIYRYFMVERDGRTGVTDIRKYRSQLVTAASETKTLSDNLKTRIQKSAYTASVLTQIADIINSKNGTIALKSKTKKSGAIFYAGAGMNQLSVKFDPSSAAKNSSSPGAYFNIGVDLFGNKDVGKLAIRVEYSVSVSHLHFTSDVLSPDYTSGQVNNSLGVQLLYNIYNRQNLKIYLAPGVKVNHATYSNSSFQIYGQGPTPTDFNFVPINESFIIQGGVLIHKRLEINAAFIPAFSDLTSNNPYWSQKFNYSRVGVNYHF